MATLREIRDHWETFREGGPKHHLILKDAEAKGVMIVTGTLFNEIDRLSKRLEKKDANSKLG